LFGCLIDQSSFGGGIDEGKWLAHVAGPDDVFDIDIRDGVRNKADPGANSEGPKMHW
jgi:hypothetical protein